MEDRNSFKITVLFVFAFCLFSCGNLENPKERNKLAFNDNICAVADSLNTMNEILFKSRNGMYTYGIDVDMNNINRRENELFLYIEDSSHSVHNVGIITDSSLYESKLLNFIDVLDRKRFVNLALYLNNNSLSSCSVENGMFYYMYRFNIYMADRQTDLVRFVVFAKSVEEIDINRYKILDNYKGLYLLANKDAKIWSSE